MGMSVKEEGKRRSQDEECNRNNEKYDDERLYAGWLATSWSEIRGDEIWFAKKPAAHGASLPTLGRR